jgi:EAL domain-containing protein (putative c-di-GMP-specific phosphodiesterase class I)/CheY-like chemotaxis protein
MVIEPLREDVPMLVVDDEPAMVRALVRQLRGLGFDDVYGHDSPASALAWLDTGARPGAVVLDLQMGELDGIEFLRALADRRFTGGVILMSGEDQRVLQTADRLARGYRLHVLGTLAKPFDLADLHRALARLSEVAAARTRTIRPPRPLAEIEAAIALGQLWNAYQPKVSMRTGRLVGVECLVRWQHPTAGVVFPDQFIAVAEENGLIDVLTRQVLQCSIRDAVGWRSQLGEVSVAVNVSMDSLTEPAFADHVFAQLSGSGLSPRQLTLEVTESRLMGNPLAALDILARMRLRKVSVSIDDFGTGYSSLAQLRDLPFDELKIDRSFVHGAANNAANRAIVEASIGIARRIGLHVVAEGVEDLDDWRLLAELGCDYVQGYFVAKPMPPSELPEWHEHWKSRVVELGLVPVMLDA